MYTYVMYMHMYVCMYVMYCNVMVWYGIVLY
jgi:hypothetical protein